jgi:hypothetical protein
VCEHLRRVPASQRQSGSERRDPGTRPASADAVRRREAGGCAATCTPQPNARVGATRTRIDSPRRGATPSGASRLRWRSRLVHAAALTGGRASLPRCRAMTPELAELARQNNNASCNLSHGVSPAKSGVNRGSGECKTPRVFERCRDFDSRERVRDVFADAVAASRSLDRRAKLLI